MNRTNSEISKEALEALKGNWALAIAAFVVYYICAFAINAIPTIGQVISIILAGPLALGASIFSISLAKGKNPDIELLFSGFNRFPQALTAYLLSLIYILLWTLLLIIPGIIAALSYSMTFFIMADDENIAGKQAMDKSKEIMKGNKMQLFILFLRFLGLALLCVLTLGIGFFWLVPYTQVCLAKFYEEVKEEESPSYF
jgi:uncharacterized membrane protein